jgi:hypothetical protein
VTAGIPASDGAYPQGKSLLRIAILAADQTRYRNKVSIAELATRIRILKIPFNKGNDEIFTPANIECSSRRLLTLHAIRTP